jgi:hypothetical protein
MPVGRASVPARLGVGYTRRAMSTNRLLFELVRALSPSLEPHGFAWVPRRMAFSRSTRTGPQFVELVTRFETRTLELSPFVTFVHPAISERILRSGSTAPDELGQQATVSVLADAVLGDPLFAYYVENSEHVADVVGDLVETFVPAAVDMLDELTDLALLTEHMVWNERLGRTFDRRIEPMHTFITALLLEATDPSRVEAYFHAQEARVGAQRVAEARELYVKSTAMNPS